MCVGVIRPLVLYPTFLAIVFFPTQVTAHSDHEAKNTVVLSFEDVTFNEWNATNKTTVLQLMILDAINRFCSHNPSRCYLNFWNDSRNFDNRHVVIVDSAQKESKNLVVKVFVFLPDGKDIQKDGHSVIAGSVLQKILLSYKDNLTFATGAEVKYIYIGMVNDSNNTTADNKMNYIMIPIVFAVLIMLCCLACFLHSSSKRRQRAIKKEQRKQLRLNKLKLSSATDGEERIQNTTSNETQTTFTVHEEIRDKKRKKHQHKFHEGDGHSKRKKRNIKQRNHQRVAEENEGGAREPAMLGEQWAREKRERVPTPIPHQRTSHHKEEIKKHDRKKKQRKTRDFKERDESYSVGSESRQPTEQTSEELLIKSLPRPRKLVPLQERTEIPL